jgi:hypothetical protein
MIAGTSFDRAFHAAHEKALREEKDDQRRRDGQYRAGGGLQYRAGEGEQQHKERLGQLDDIEVDHRDQLQR